MARRAAVARDLRARGELRVRIRISGSISQRSRRPAVDGYHGIYIVAHTQTVYALLEPQ